MRAVMYEVGNGVITNNYAYAKKEAKDFDTTFSTLLVDVPKPPVQLTEKQKARRVKAVAPSKKA